MDTSRAQTRVACLGDSITYGQGAGETPLDLANSAYPAVLGHLLGVDYDVRGFGASGHTLRPDGPRPYGSSEAFTKGLAFRPDLAVVMLGTNDSHHAEEGGDWGEPVAGRVAVMVSQLREANPDIRVLLVSPPAIFPDAPGLPGERARNLRQRQPRLEEISGALRGAARTMEAVEFVHMRDVLRPRDVTDGVHPNAFGAERIAYRLAGAISMDVSAAAAPWSALLEARPDARVSGFHGFERADFSLAGEGSPACVLVAPDRVAKGAPWIWRARFFGHEPALDLALLDRGLHLAYVDIAGLFGGPEAMARMAAFQSFCESTGLGPKPILEGMSRGGMAIVEYAKASPDRVAALYGDNPVVDLRSWPGGRSGKRSDVDWAAALRAWNLEDSTAWELDAAPLSGLEPVAAAGVPLFLVVGTDDLVVPPAENAERLGAAYLAAGGAVTIWRKPGLDHHPHGLDPVAPLLRGLLRAVGQHSAESEPSVHAAPSAEYRGQSAGWGGGTWRTAFRGLQVLGEAARSGPPMDVVFLGDSITQSLTGHTDRMAVRGGERPFDRYQGGRRAVSLGLSGDRTEHLLYRIGLGSLDDFRARVIVLQIGINNINAAGHTGHETFDGIVAVVNALGTRFPGTEIVIAGPFPAGRSPELQVRRSVEDVHARLASCSQGARVHYLDLSAHFIDEQGKPRPTLGHDSLHVTTEGREAWMAGMEAVLVELLD